MKSVNGLFEKFDANKDGQLDRNEIRTASREMGQEILDQDLEATSQIVDTNKDGKISKNELTEFL